MAWVTVWLKGRSAAGSGAAGGVEGSDVIEIAWGCGTGGFGMEGRSAAISGAAGSLKNVLG